MAGGCKVAHYIPCLLGAIGWRVLLRQLQSCIWGCTLKTYPCWQAAIARSSKWGTTEPSSRPSPSRQGSQGSGQLEAMGSAGSGGLPTRPLLSDPPRPTKLDALLHAQQLAQQQQQQQHSGSSCQEGKPGQAGLGSRRAFSGQLPATQSAAQFGVNGAQVSIPVSVFD